MIVYPIGIVPRTSLFFRTCRFNTDILQEGDTAEVKGQ